MVHVVKPDVGRQPPKRHGKNKVGGADNHACVVTLDPLEADVARAALAELVRLRSVGQRTPLPLPVGTGECFAARLRSSADPSAAFTAAAKQWSDGLYPDCGDEAHALVWGAGAPFDVLRDWTAPPGTFDAGVAGDTDFERLARTVWDTLLGHEKQEIR